MRETSEPEIVWIACLIGRLRAEGILERKSAGKMARRFLKWFIAERGALIALKTRCDLVSVGSCAELHLRQPWLCHGHPWNGDDRQQAHHFIEHLATDKLLVLAPGELEKARRMGRFSTPEEIAST